MIGKKYWYANVLKVDLVKVEVIDFGICQPYWKIRELDEQTEYEVLGNHLFDRKKTAKNFLINTYKESVRIYTRSLTNAQNCLDKIERIFA